MMFGSKNARRGMALVNVLIFAIVSVAAISASSQYFSQTMRVSRKSSYDEQAYNIALAGVQHAISWLNRQDLQPVTTFDPKGVAADDADAADTPPIEEQLGLVGEVTLDADRNLKARYEVGRSQNAPNRDGLASGAALPAYLAGLPTIYPSTPGITWVAKDLGPSRGLAPGEVWRLRCRAYVWDASLGAWGTVPPLKDIIVEADIERRTLQPYTASIFHWGDGGAIGTIDVKASNAVDVRVANGTGGSYWTHQLVKFTTEPPQQNSSGNHEGISDPASPQYVAPSVKTHMEHVLGVRDEGLLEGMATHYFASEAELPPVLEGHGVFYVKSNVHFDSAHRLNASGVFVGGNEIHINGSSPAQQRFRGVMMAMGGTFIKGPTIIEGSLVAGARFRIEGDSTATTSVRYHRARVDDARAIYDEYKLRHSTLRVLNASQGD